MKKTITIIAGLLFLLALTQCVKDDPVTPDDNSNNGTVEIPQGLSNSDIIISNFGKEVTPDEDGGFTLENSSMLVAKNANNGKLIYFSLNSIDRNVRNTTDNNCELNAKETALFITMRLLPTSMMDAPDQSLMNMKSLLYDLPCVKNLETAIQTVVDSKGYLEEEQIKTAVDAVKDYIYEKFMVVTQKETEMGKAGSALVHESLNSPYFSPNKKHGVRVIINSSNYINNDNDFYDSWKVNCDVQNSLMTMWGFFETNIDGINYIDVDNLKYLPPTGLTNFVDQLISFDGLVQIYHDACNILSDADYSPEFGKFIVKNLELDFPATKNALRFVGPNSCDRVLVAYLVYDCLYFVDLGLDALLNLLLADGAHILKPIGIEDLVLGCVADGELVSFIMSEKDHGASGYRLIANAILEKATSLIYESVQPDDYASTQIHNLIDGVSSIDGITKGFDLLVGAGFNGFANDFSFSFVAEYENQFYPSLLTYEVENIGVSTAQFKGEVFPVQGGLSIEKRGFIYGTEPITTALNGISVLCQTDDDVLQYDITGLQAFTYYYVRSCVQLSDGSVFLGNEVGFKTLSAVPMLTTYPADDFYITSTSALFEGKLEGVPVESVSMRGFLYNTSPQVNINQPGVMSVDAEEGVGLGEFSAMATGLVPGEKYYYVAFVIVNNEPFHGPELSFTTLPNGGGSQDYVDLGLPSGKLWATCNVGAENPEDYGDYFAWGEIQPKNYYDWSTYQYCNDSYNALTKYCNNASYGNNGFTDNLTILQPEDDAATANLGNGWRIPTKEEWQELYNNVSHTWTTQNGVKGCLFAASNGKTLFLPAAGCRWDNELDGVGSLGSYWSSAFNTDYPYNALYLGFVSGICGMDNSARSYGLSVRAVRSAR